MESVGAFSAQNTCMICLCPLLVPNAASPRLDDNDDLSRCSSAPTNDNQAEIGSVFPCGHVFHLTCFAQWSEHEKKQRCPTCSQEATLFCKLFLTAPPPAPAVQPCPPPVQVVTVAADCESAAAPDNSNQMEEEDEKEQRQILVDLRTATQAGPAQTIRKVVSLRSKLRKVRREGKETKSELESTQLVLELTQEELELTRRDLEEQRQKVQDYRGKLARIQSQHWKRHEILREELVHQHTRQITDLRKELQDVRMELALRNRQLHKDNPVAVEDS